MIEVLFFGRVREELNCSALQVTLAEDTATLESLQRHLCARGGAKWTAILGEDNIVRAVNHTVAEGDIGLSDGDEVAFFPPVTGG